MIKVSDYLNNDKLGQYALMFMVLVTPFAHTVALRNLGIFLCLVFIIIDVAREGFDQSLPYKGPILFWLLVVWCSLIYSVDTSHSLGELRHETIYTLILFYAAYVLARKGLSFDLVLAVFLTSFVLLSIGVISVVHYFGVWNNNYYSGVGNYSTYLVIAVPMIVYFLVTWPAPYIRAVLLVALAISLYAGLLSQNRMLWVVLIAELLMGLYIYIQLYSRSSRKKVVSLVLTVMIILLALLALNYVKKQAESIDAVFTEDVRIGHWSKVVLIITDSPGYGLGFGKDLLGKEYPELMLENKQLMHAHNLILDYGVMAGLPGIAAILILFSAFYRFYLSGYRIAPEITLLMVVLITGLLLKNMSDNFFGRDQSLIFWIMVGLSSGAISRKASNSNTLRTSEP